MRIKEKPNIIPEEHLDEFCRRLDSLKYTGKREDRWKNVVEFLQPLAEKYSDDIYILKELSLAHFNSDHNDEALKYAEKAMAIDSHVASVWDAYACALLNDGRYDNAIELYNKILRKSVADIAYGAHSEGWRWAQSMHIDAFFRKALCYDGKGDYKEAIRMMKLHMRKRKRGIYSDFTKKSCVKYLKELEYFAKILPRTQANKFQERLNFLKSSDEWEKVIEFLQPLADKYTNDYFILTELSEAQHNIKRYKEALRNATKALKIESHDIIVWDAYACALLYNDRYNEAIEWYNKILRKSITDIAYGPHGEGWKWAQSFHIDAFFWKACCYDCKGDYREARRLTKLHLRKRQRGVVSNFTKNKVLDFLRYLDEKLHQ